MYKNIYVIIIHDWMRELITWIIIIHLTHCIVYSAILYRKPTKLSVSYKNYLGKCLLLFTIYG